MGAGAQTPALTALLCLGLCWAPGDKAQAEAWPSPSISAEPGPTVLLGQPVTIVCRSFAEFDTFRLEKEGILVKIERSMSPNQREARFPLLAMDADTAGRYRCLYYKSGTWSERSGELELVVIPEDVPRASDPGPSQLCPQCKAVCVCGYGEASMKHLINLSAMAWESSGRWPKCLGPCTHVGDLEEALAPGFRLVRLQLLRPTGE
ncbi:leukocyte-associated immunoglobulin-like receptor 2 [Oryctolagus cuniculus]|uniref:leukocyte-associated immunoglobulin-like receptor 2 n=1 Tax=Oryctolagus cuniculus TaxID=9986 RepID=UPI0038797F28